jgi:LPXTG-site transpeptidase (sortase) family protein
VSDNGWSLGRRGGFALAAAVVVAGLVLVVVVIRAQVSAPQPHAAGRINPASPPVSNNPKGNGRSSGTSTGSAPNAGPVPLSPSRPLSIQIPAIGVDTLVYPLGLAPDGTLAVPQPGPHLNNAAWFKNSPTPGQPGPAIIEGHVDSTEGPSVFFKLGAITPGDRVYIKRQDGRTLTFQVDAVRDYLKAKFPTSLVYGAQQPNTPTLRLITCSDFNASTHHHVGNEVVFTHLTHTTGPTSF